MNKFIPIFNKKFDALLVTYKAIVKKIKDNLGLAKDFFNFDENVVRDAINTLEPTTNYYAHLHIFKRNFKHRE